MTVASVNMSQTGTTNLMSAIMEQGTSQVDPIPGFQQPEPVQQEEGVTDGL